MTQRIRQNGLSRTRMMRVLIESPEPEYLLEAHNGLSARIAQESGARGIWASGLAIAAQYGVRDSNEVSWTQVVDMAEFMADATAVPILFDGDTGFGNFNNVRRLVRKLEPRGISGVCLEDKCFPKTNSFVRGARQPLADVDEFCGKIRAARDARRDPDFCIVARTEAFIAGWDVTEALRRAERYHRAGADAILIHSKQPDAREIRSFAEAWRRRAPLVIVPTTYAADLTPAMLAECGIGLVIWANHLVRAGVTAMQAAADRIIATGSVTPIEDDIASIEELFRLQAMDELQRARKRYEPAPGGRTVLAVDPADTSCPGGWDPRWRDSLRQHGFTKIIRTAEAIGNGTAAVAAIAALCGELTPDTLILPATVAIGPTILGELTSADAPVTVVIDSAASKVEGPDAAWCTSPDTRAAFPTPVELRGLGAPAAGGCRAAHGRWIGAIMLRQAGRRWLADALEELRSDPRFTELTLGDLLTHLLASRRVRVLYTHGRWSAAATPHAATATAGASVAS